MANLNVISWFDKSTVKHLRMPFSWHLMPVFLFALSQAQNINWMNALFAFIILHLLIYPSSNGYNSYQDKDEGSIGGLKHPPRVSENLFYATALIDATGVIAAFFVSPWFAAAVLVYILVSRAYSYRRLRLKKYALTGFLTVFIFQGAFTYLMAGIAFNDFSPANFFNAGNVICMCVASLFIGSVYPLTQIYQHEADRKDGVTTISYKLGYLGTFFFSASLFTAAMILLFLYFSSKGQLTAFIVFNIMMLPVVIRLLFWFMRVKKDRSHANFENTMSMNLMASTCMNVYFLILIFNSVYHWF